MIWGEYWIETRIEIIPRGNYFLGDMLQFHVFPIVAHGLPVFWQIFRFWWLSFRLRKLAEFESKAEAWLETGGFALLGPPGLWYIHFFLSSRRFLSVFVFVSVSVLESVFVSLAVAECFFVFVSVSVLEYLFASVVMPGFVFVSLSGCVSWFVSVFLSVVVSVFVSAFVSWFVSAFVFVSVTVSVFIYVFVYEFYTYLNIYICICAFMHPTGGCGA